MTDEELVAWYRRDSAITYELGDSELQRLLALVGEEEPIIDAIMCNGGQTIEARAEAIGVKPSDFWYEGE